MSQNPNVLKMITRSL